MANICNFQMKIWGEKENVDSFIKAMQQDGIYCMGRGACVDYRDNDGECELISGWCKWSISSSLDYDAMTMAKQKKTGVGSWYNEDGFIDEHEFISIIEATEKWNLKVEIVSWESSCCFSEYYMINNGEVVEENEVEYTEYYNEEADEWISSGGFECLF